MSTIDRGKAAELGREAVAISERGYYSAPDGTTVSVGEAVRAATAGTVEYPQEERVPRPAAGAHTTEFAVVNQTTLAAAQHLVGRGFRVAALNFASAKNPGGGFLNGARAQEESLCRSSALYLCLRDCDMYPRHRPTTGGMYTDSVIYSPDVPVFRDDDGDLLAEPYLVSFLTSPAVNAGRVLKDGEAHQERITAVMRERVAKVLGVAAHHGHEALVLGAWGCGVFGNDPEVVADLFREALSGRFHGVFRAVTFAVVDWSDDERTISPFRERFGGRT